MTDREFQRFEKLSDREREVTKLLALGCTNREIAGQLDVSIKTIDTHRLHAIKKLGVRNNVELARLALRAGFVELAAQGYEIKTDHPPRRFDVEDM